MSESENKSHEIRMSRRLFFGLAIGGGTAACVAVLSAPSVRDRLFQKLDQQSLEERVISEATDNRRSWIRTLLETIGAYAAVVGGGSLMDRLTGIKHGGRAADGELGEPLHHLVERSDAGAVNRETEAFTGDSVGGAYRDEHTADGFDLVDRCADRARQRDEDDLGRDVLD